MRTKSCQTFRVELLNKIVKPYFPFIVLLTELPVLNRAGRTRADPPVNTPMFFLALPIAIDRRSPGRGPRGPIAGAALANPLPRSSSEHENKNKTQHKPQNRPKTVLVLSHSRFLWDAAAFKCCVLRFLSARHWNQTAAIAAERARARWRIDNRGALRGGAPPRRPNHRSPSHCA